MPGWQKEMSRAIQEMKQFSNAEDTNENSGANGRGEDKNAEGDAGEAYWFYSSNIIQLNAFPYPQYLQCIHNLFTVHLSYYNTLFTVIRPT